MTESTLAHRAEIRRRNAQRKSKDAKRRNRLYPWLWAIVIFAVVYGTLWIAYG
jgi:multidrug resistance efflux pump